MTVAAMLHTPASVSSLFRGRYGPVSADVIQITLKNKLLLLISNK
jgi:hypothetical protein